MKERRKECRRVIYLLMENIQYQLSEKPERWVCKEEELFYLWCYLVLTCGFFNCQEEIRRQTSECLEEESIKNSKLRFKLQDFPGEVTEELTGSTDFASSEKKQEKLIFWAVKQSEVFYKINLAAKGKSLSIVTYECTKVGVCWGMTLFWHKIFSHVRV